jgi:outer membrane protein assembly factor BamB
MKTQAAFPLLYIGIKNSVVALDKQTGRIVWSTKLRSGSSLVTVVHEDAAVFATASGEAWCLNAASGKILWHQKLAGFGSSWTTIAGAGSSSNTSATAAAVQASAAAAAAVAAAT